MSGDLLESRNGQVKSPAHVVPCPTSSSAHLCAALAVGQDDWVGSPSMQRSFGLAMLCFTQFSVTVITQPAVCGL